MDDGDQELVFHCLIGPLPDLTLSVNGSPPVPWKTASTSTPWGSGVAPQWKDETTVEITGYGCTDCLLATGGQAVYFPSLDALIEHTAAVHGYREPV